MCPEIAWRIIMGSGLDDWIYWHFFTITIDSNSPQSMAAYNLLHSLLYHERLLFLCDECRTKNHCSHIELPFEFSYEWIYDWIELSLSLILRPTVSRPVSLGIKQPFGAYGQISNSVSTLRGLLKLGALSDERTDLSFTIATGPRQRSHSRVWVPWDSWPYFTVSDSRLSFLSPPTTRRVTVEVFTPPPHGRLHWIEFWVLCYDRRSAGQSVLE
jgi:hypothetical protein